MSFNNGLGQARHIVGSHRPHSPSLGSITPQTMASHNSQSSFTDRFNRSTMNPNPAMGSTADTATATGQKKPTRAELIARLVSATTPTSRPRSRAGDLPQKHATKKSNQSLHSRVIRRNSSGDEITDDEKYAKPQSQKRKRSTKHRLDEESFGDESSDSEADRRAKRRSHRQGDRMAPAIRVGGRRRRSRSVSNSPYIPSRNGNQYDDSAQKKKPKSIPVPKCLSEAGEADTMMWKAKQDGKGWLEINQKWEEITGVKPGRSTLSVRWLKLNENFSANDNANDVLLLNSKDKAEKKLESNLWKIVADIMQEESGFYHPPDVLRKRYNFLKEKDWDLTKTQQTSITAMESEKTDDMTQTFADASNDTASMTQSAQEMLVDDNLRHNELSAAAFPDFDSNNFFSNMSAYASLYEGHNENMAAHMLHPTMSAQPELPSGQVMATTNNVTLNHPVMKVEYEPVITSLPSIPGGSQLVTYSSDSE